MSTFSKFIENREGGGLKNFAREGGGGGGKEKCGGLPGKVLRFFWRFLMMQHRKNNADCDYLFFVNKNVAQNNCLKKILVMLLKNMMNIEKRKRKIC